MKTKTINFIEVQDWDELVTQTYGRPYSFQQQNGCKARSLEYISVPDTKLTDYQNDTVPEVVNHNTMGVSFAAWLARDPNQKLNGNDPDYRLIFWWHRNFFPDVQMVANDLHDRGLLKAGEYAIIIDW